MSAVDELKINAEAALQRWEDSCRSAIPACGAYSSQEVRDNFPDLLSAIVASLEGLSIESTESLRQELAIEHARRRASLPEYTLREVIEEYRILRRVLLDLLNDECANKRDSDIVGSALFQGVVESAMEFVRIHRDKVTQLLHDRDLFMATITHDLRQPLTAGIIALSVFMKNHQRVELVAKGIDNLRKAERIVSNLLDICQIRFGKPLPLNLQSCDLRKIASDIAADFSAIYGNRFNCEYGDHEVVGCWDEAYLRRALDNLVINAFKYGSQNEPITIKVGDSESEAWVSVHNHGPVIPHEEKKRLFLPFERQSKPEGGNQGRGLGLTLVKGVVDSLGGWVDVQSEAPAGTTFTLKIPKERK